MDSQQPRKRLGGVGWPEHWAPPYVVACLAVGRGRGREYWEKTQ